MATERQLDFVHHHVTEFMKRHRNKVRELNPMPSYSEAIQANGSEELKDADKELTVLHKTMGTAIENYNAAVARHTGNHGDEIAQLMEAAERENIDRIEKACHEFDFEIREAIGEVELGRPEEAKRILSRARNKIESLSKTEA